MKLKLVIHADDINFCIKLVLDCGQIRTQVAMATYIFCRLVMGKVEIGIFMYQLGYKELSFL